MTGSMSRRGNCWDNACVEGFFGTLKRELIYQRQYRSRDERGGPSWLDSMFHFLSGASQ